MIALSAPTYKHREARSEKRAGRHGTVAAARYILVRFIAMFSRNDYLVRQ